ncbi:vegetative cell wall protein gp1-like [Papaver somniferum]|uniref:vegetative cell wall protein gp1-like n=1 Tax=Papaver somniferum TaxID=3469 RepID=UPI000E6F89E0|nr:vegetative cell wall protein gp1-like [Papaver somniferum]
MADHHRIPYQTPPSSPYRSPPSKSPDVSPSKGGPPSPPASQRADATNASSLTPQRAEQLDIQPLRYVSPTTKPSQKSMVPPSTAPVKGKSAKGSAPKADPSRNPPTKRKTSYMSPPNRPSADKADDSDAATVIRSVSVGKKKVTFKHIDLEVFKVKHEIEDFDIKFYAPDDDLTYDLSKNYKYDDFHLLTTVGAFEAGLILPLYKSGDSFY